jgi:hypothetical protein
MALGPPRAPTGARLVRHLGWRLVLQITAVMMMMILLDLAREGGHALMPWGEGCAAAAAGAWRGTWLGRSSGNDPLLRLPLEVGQVRAEDRAFVGLQMLLENLVAHRVHCVPHGLGARGSPAASSRRLTVLGLMVTLNGRQHPARAGPVPCTKTVPMARAARGRGRRARGQVVVLLVQRRGGGLDVLLAVVVRVRD